MHSQDLLNKKAAEAINEVLRETSHQNLIAFGEPEATFEVTPMDDGERTFVRNRIPEITIAWRVNRIPEVVSEIENLSEWFSDVSPQLPYVQISISSQYHTNPMYDTQNGVEIPPKSVIHNNKFPLEYHIVEHPDGDEVIDRLDIPEGLKVVTTTEFTIGWIQEEFLPQIFDEITDPDTDELIDYFSIDAYVRYWEDTVFHFDQVLRAYRQDQIGLLIVLLSVFFESHLLQGVEEYLEKIKQNEYAGSLTDDIRFETILDYCRYFALIEESEYGLLKKIKDSRNAYAHDLSAFRSTQKTPLEAEGKVDDAIRLYEDYIDVKKSMTN